MLRWLSVLLSSIILTAQSASVAVSAQAAQAPAQAPAGQAPATNQPGQRDLVLEGQTKAPEPASTAVPRGYAVVIGVGFYEHLDAARQLKYAESDADAVYRVLINHEGGSFPAENVHVLKGKQATLANIRHELEDWLPSVAQPTDRVVVFFAGHGFVKAGRGYLAGTDVDPAHLDSTAYPMTTLGTVLGSKVKARWKVLLADACHSGKINQETTSEALDMQFSGLPQNFLTLTATTERESSYEDAKLSTGFGFFTYFLVQAWQGNADNDPCDGRITADEMIEYVHSNVRRYAKDHNVSQTPTAHGDYDPAMLLGVSKPCLAVAGAAAPSMMGRAIIEVNLDDVDLYIDGMLVGKLTKDKPLIIPQLSSGLHEFKGVKQGYEPDRKEMMIPPGQDATVTLRIRYVRQVKKAALDLNADGEKLLFTQRSSLNPLNIVPVARTQSEGDLQKARDLFTKALVEDPNASVAAYNLGQVNQLLSDEDASISAYKRAVEIDPSYVDARTQYAAVLIEHGDADEAIRQLTEVLRLEAKNDEVYSMLSRAYWDKAAWARAVELADKAIDLKPANAQAHLWKADALRQLAAAEKDKGRQTALYSQSREDYREFLNLTNFSTPAYQWVAFHFIGFHVGGQKHADRQGPYNNLRSAGFLGLCLSEDKVGNPLRAREYCQRALKYAPEDPIAHFILGNVNRDLFNTEQSCDYLVAARNSYSTMIKLNADLEESRHAKDYVEQINGILPKLRCKA